MTKSNGKSAASGTALLPTKHPLSAETRKASVDTLNAQLADTFDLMSQCKQAHWNLKGANFIALHELYDQFEEGLEEYVDAIAERVTALGGVATGTVRMAAAHSRLPEFPLGPIECMASVAALADRFAALAKTTGDAILSTDEDGDKGSSDLLTGVVRDLDKWLWFLEAHLQ